VDEGFGARPHREPGVLEGVEVPGGHVFVVEGDDGAPVGHLHERVEVAVVADEMVGDDLRGGDAVGLGEQAQRQTERDGRLGHHPGQLTAADHGEGGSGR
jgi:hypothetical protein